MDIQELRADVREALDASMSDADRNREALIRVLDDIEALPGLYRIAALGYGFDILDCGHDPAEARAQALRFASQ